MRLRSIKPVWIAAPAVAVGVFGIPFLAAQESRPLRTPTPDTRAANSMFGPPPAQVTVTSTIKSNNQPDPNMKPAGLFFPDAAPPPLPTAPTKIEVVPVPVPTLPTKIEVVPVPAPTLPIIPPAVPTVSAPMIPSVPASLPPPRVVETAPTVEVKNPEPKPLQLQPIPTFTPPVPEKPIAVMPVPQMPAIPTGPQPLVPVTPAPTAIPTTITVSQPPAILPTISHASPVTMNVAQALPFPTMQLLAKHSPNVLLEVLMPESVSVGANLDYILVVKNTGTASIAHVKVDDELPAGTKFVSSEPAAEQNGDRLAWNVGTLDAGTEKRIKVSVKPSNEGEVRSRAMVSFTAAAEARVKVTRPRVTVGLTGLESVRVGEEVPFTIRVTNTGSGPASNVMVKARLTDGLHHPAGGQIEAMIDKLPAGETKTITLRALATKSGSNQCAITTTGDGISVEAASSAVSIVEPLLTAKVAGPAKCIVHSQPEFKIDLSNPGSTATDPISVWAVVPEGFQYVSCSDSGNYNAANRTIVWTLPPLNATGGRFLSLKLKAGSASAGTVKVIAQASPVPTDGVVMAGGRSGGNRILEVKTECAVKAEGVPALRFEVIDMEDPVEVGKEAIYEIKVTNTGSGACTNVSLVATLADGTTTSAANGPTTARGQGQQIIFDPLPTLAAKGETIYRVKIRGTVAGDTKLRVQITCDEIRTPTIKEENTRFFKD